MANIDLLCSVVDSSLFRYRQFSLFCWFFIRNIDLRRPLKIKIKNRSQNLAFPDSFKWQEFFIQPLGNGSFKVHSLIRFILRYISSKSNRTRTVIDECFVFFPSEPFLFRFYTLHLYAFYS